MAGEMEKKGGTGRLKSDKQMTNSWERKLKDQHSGLLIRVHFV